MNEKIIEIKPKTFLKKNLFFIFLIIIIHIVSFLIKYSFKELPNYPLNYLYYLFNFDIEKNISSGYAALMIFVSSLILLIISYFEDSKKDKFYFNCLSGVFFFLGCDELFQIHEQFTMLFGRFSNGFFFYSWVIPYAFLSIFLALFFLKFVLKFRKKIRNYIFFAGSLYLLGELIFELFSGKLVSVYGPPSEMVFPQIIIYFFFMTIEESLGLFGILVFNYALLKLLKIKIGKLKFYINA